MTGRLGFDFTFSAPGSPRPRGPGKTFRLLLLADFVGDARPSWLLRKVDVDNLDALVASTAPAVTVAMVDGQREAVLTFTSLDDFHPDELLRKVPALSALNATRLQLLQPATFAAAAAHVFNEPAAPAESMLTKLLGGNVGSASRASQGEDAWIKALLKDSVAAHVVQAASAQQATLIAAVEESLSRELRGLLHAPAFARVEAAWRGLERLIDAVRPDAGVEVWLCSSPANAVLKELAACGARGDALDASAFAQLLLGADAPPFSAVILDHDVGDDVESFTALSALAAISARAGATVLAGAAPALMGSGPSAALVSPGAGGPHPDPAIAQIFTLLRTSPLAPHVGLVFPRWLLRLPYGPRRNEVQAFAFDELGMVTAPPSERLLWGSGALVAAMALATAFVDDPREMPLGRAATVDGACAFTYVDPQGDRQLFPPTGTWLSQGVAEAVLERGVMPLVAHRQLAQATLLRLQSIASPATALDVRAV